jgi:hypothetical protein
MADDDPRDNAGPPPHEEPAPVTPTVPAATEPAATEPAATEPTVPAPRVSAPTEPAPTEPAPIEPWATEPAPTDPWSTEPAPADPWSTGSAADQPAPDRPTASAGQETVASGRTGIGPSGTTTMPTLPEPAAPPRWSGRAQVRPPEQKHLGAGWDDPVANWDQAGSEWDEREPRESRRLLGPILVTLVVLVLLGILAFGVWQVLRSQNGSQNTGTVPTPTDTGTTATAQSSTQPAATLPPTTAAPPPVPASVGIPNVSGSDYGGAVATLQALGFQTRRTDQTSTTVPAGAVIGTDPPIGTVLPASSTVTIIVSSGSPTTPPAAQTSPPAAPTPTGTKTPGPTRPLGRPNISR